MDKPKCWVKILTQFQLSLSTVIFFFLMFNPTFGFVHIIPKFGLKQPTFLERNTGSVFTGTFDEFNESL